MEYALKAEDIGNSAVSEDNTNKPPNDYGSDSVYGDCDRKSDGKVMVTPQEMKKTLHWIDEMCLTLKHKDAIENNEILNDEHIQAAHNLMKKQFPQLGGLQSTLLCQTDTNVKNSGLNIQAELLHESSILFCKSLNRLPDQKSILIFGIKPCQGFLLMRCEEFVTKFLSILKVDKEEIPNYHLHVAQLRKFCRTEKSSRSMAHKGFDAWLKSNYEGGQPTAVDLQTAQDDEDCIVAPSPTIYATSPLPVPAEDGNLNDGDANLSPRSLSGY
eukprot:Em0001g2679a